jgi:DNA-binding CsgD family transcriptional regulator
VDKILESIAECEGLPQLWRTMLTFFRERGFGAVCYMAYFGSSVAHAQSDSIQSFYHGFKPEAIKAYLESDHDRLDIVPRLTMALGKPVHWKDAWENTAITEEERRFLTLMREVQLGDGYGLPCYGPKGRDAFVGIGAMAQDALTDEVSLREMHMLAQAAHLRICALTDAGLSPERILSAREREILEWVARGKSNGVIAEILGLSIGTVDTYLRRTYDKLGVSDRTSAAVRGVGMGLIAA